MQHAEQGFAPRLLLRGLRGLRFIKGVGQHRHMTAVDDDFAILRHALHFAPRGASGLKGGDPCQIRVPWAAQRRLQTVDDAEVVANRQAVIDHLLRLIRRGVVLINKFTAQLTEHHRLAHRIRAPSTT